MIHQSDAYAAQRDNRCVDWAHIAQDVWRIPATAKHHGSKRIDVSHSSILPGTRAQEEEVYED